MGNNEKINDEEFKRILESVNARHHKTFERLAAYEEEHDIKLLDGIFVKSDQYDRIKKMLEDGD